MQGRQRVELAGNLANFLARTVVSPSSETILLFSRRSLRMYGPDRKVESVGGPGGEIRYGESSDVKEPGSRGIRREAGADYSPVRVHPRRTRQY